jgi:hypothetical protein
LNARRTGSDRPLKLEEEQLKKKDKDRMWRKERVDSPERKSHFEREGRQAEERRWKKTTVSVMKAEKSDRK